MSDNNNTDNNVNDNIVNDNPPSGQQPVTTTEDVQFSEEDFMDNTIRADISTLQLAVESQHHDIQTATLRMQDLGNDVNNVWHVSVK